MVEAPPQAPPAPSRVARARPFLVAAGVLAAAILLLSAVATLYTEVLWFREIGFSQVFRRTLATKLLLGCVFGPLFAAFVGANLWFAARRARALPSVVEQVRLNAAGKAGAVAGVALAGTLAGFSAARQWSAWLMARNAVAFGTADPVYGRDLSFYVFHLPFERWLYTLGLVAIAVAIGAALLAYYVNGAFEISMKGIRVEPGLAGHVSVLVGLFVLLKAWGYRLGRFDLLYSKRGPVQGASYTDVHAQAPAFTLLSIVAIIAAIILFANARRERWSLVGAAVALLALTAVIAGAAYPAAVQRFRVAPNERIRERATIERNLDATRAAYGIDDVTERPFPARGVLTARAVRDAEPTIDNIRLWDPQVLISQFLNQQRIKQYYQFLNIDADRYTVGGARREVMVAAREMDPRGLPGSAQSWINRHLVYTHGYGIVASRVDRVVGEGGPDFVARDVPVSSEPGMEVTQPRIYFGESRIPNFVVVGTDQVELDFPRGASFAATSYEGSGGIPLKGFGRRLAFAVRFHDLNLLISGAIHGDSRLMFRRTVRQRVQQAAPFLRFDADPYITVADGRLVWIVDGYTTTDMIPYAQRSDFGDDSDGAIAGRGNYIRNAAKFTVDALDGTVTGYVWDPNDPILRTWMRAFPGLLRPRSEMPRAVLEHVRYPQGLFKIQTSRYAAYHIASPDDFYSREDVWSIAGDPRRGRSAAVRPEYVLQGLPGEPGLPFLLVRPFTPVGRPNLTAYMVAHSDPADYGRLVAFEFPTTEPVAGPELVQARINQDPAVSQQITLWSQQHSQVIRGNVFIVPVGDALLYVQALYLQGQGSQLPELKRVVAVSGQEVKMADTLQEAVGQLLASNAGLGRGDILEEVRAAREHLRLANDALRAGDLGEFARQLEVLGRILDRAARG